MVDNTKPNKELIAVHTNEQQEYQIEMQSRIIETNEIPKPEYSKNRKSESWKAIRHWPCYSATKLDNEYTDVR